MNGGGVRGGVRGGGCRGGGFAIRNIPPFASNQEDCFHWSLKLLVLFVGRNSTPCCFPMTGT